MKSVTTLVPGRCVGLSLLTTTNEILFQFSFFSARHHGECSQNTKLRERQKNEKVKPTIDIVGRNTSL